MAYRTYLGAALADTAAGTEGCNVEIVGEGAMLEMADGSVVYDYTNVTRYRWNLHWVGITAAQLSTIQTRAAVKTAQSFSPPDEDDAIVGFHNVFVVPNSLGYESFETGAGTPYFNVDLTVEQES